MTSEKGFELAYMQNNSHFPDTLGGHLTLSQLTSGRRMCKPPYLSHGVNLVQIRPRLLAHDASLMLSAPHPLIGFAPRGGAGDDDRERFCVNSLISSR